MLFTAKELVTDINTENESHPISDQFIRKEQKFFLPNELREEFMQLVNKHLPAFYPIANTEYTLIESVYYDSASLKSLRDHINRKDYRFKLRARRYAPNGIWKPKEESGLYLELKVKHNKMTDKKRVKVDVSDLKRVETGKGLHLSLKKYMLVNTINKAIKISKPRPVCRVEYRRYAFQEGGLRITVDDQINTQSLIDSSYQNAAYVKHHNNSLSASIKHFDVNKYSLVEIKHLSDIPDWLINYMQEKDLVFRNFSKYCFTMLNIIENKTI